MSIWASFCVFDGDDDLPAPIRYQQSHILPAATDDRAGWFGLGLIPGFITRDGRDDGPEDDDACWPYLRVGVAEDDNAGSTVVLDAGQVTDLRDALDGWLARLHRSDPDGSNR